MSYLAAFVIVFVAGPLLMLALTRKAGSKNGFALVAALALALMATALLWQEVPGFLALGMIWLAWVVTVALCVRAAMRWAQTRKQLALTKSVGAMATALPWMGLAVADWMAG
ncbi:hypothetical protein DZK27_12905 [Rhodobacteraceae bacterium 63075]|nr:hypothetical protein DZK27_12905 [Rhodobacteraceae bacterium 63075]